MADAAEYHTVLVAYLYSVASATGNHLFIIKQARHFLKANFILQQKKCTAGVGRGGWGGGGGGGGVVMGSNGYSMSCVLLLMQGNIWMCGGAV